MIFGIIAFILLIGGLATIIFSSDEEIENEFKKNDWP